MSCITAELSAWLYCIAQCDNVVQDQWFAPELDYCATLQSNFKISFCLLQLRKQIDPGPPVSNSFAFVFAYLLSFFVPENVWQTCFFLRFGF